MERVPQLSSIASSVLPFIVILLVLVVVHELGHFLTAKAFGIKVLEFGFGYPPRIWAIKRGDTEYSINILPLGGFVRLLGEEDPGDPHSLAAQAAWKRLIVMAAGSYMNFVLAILMFSIALMIPRVLPAGRPQIVQVVPGSPAAQAGLLPGDIIYSVNGRTIESVPDASYNIRLHQGETLDIVVKRTDPQTGGASLVTVHPKARWAPPSYVYEVLPGDTVDSVAAATTFDRASVRLAAGISTEVTAGTALALEARGEVIQFTAEKGDTVETIARRFGVSEEAVASAAGLPDPSKLEAGRVLRFTQGATGIRIASQYDFTETRSLGPWSALKEGFRQTLDSLKLARNAVISWLKGGESPGISGPIGIAQTTGEVVKEVGWKSLTDLAALLSINLAILNILPLPMLDGGRIAFVLIEVLRRGKRVAPAKEALVHLIGMAALLLLVVVLSYFDVLRIIRGESLFR